MMRSRMIQISALCVLHIACDSTVHLRLSSGDSDAAEQQCNSAVSRTLSVYAELQLRELVLKKCVDLPGGEDRAMTLAELESTLSRRLVFENVPHDDQWSIWLEGFAVRGCTETGIKETPVLCGRAELVNIPPANNDYTLLVSCAPDGLWDASVLGSLCRSRSNAP